MRTALRAFMARRIADRLVRLLNEAEESGLGVEQDPERDFGTGYQVTWRDGRATRVIRVLCDEGPGSWGVRE